MIECVEGWHLVRILRLILATLVGVVLVSGCDRAPKHHVPVTRDLMNARFEEGSEYWLFVHNEQSYGQLAAADSEVCPVNGEWVLLTATAAIPRETEHIKVYACADGTDGIAHFDDFQVTRR